MQSRVGWWETKRGIEGLGMRAMLYLILPLFPLAFRCFSKDWIHHCNSSGWTCYSTGSLEAAASVKTYELLWSHKPATTGLYTGCSVLVWSGVTLCTGDTKNASTMATGCRGSHSVAGAPRPAHTALLTLFPHSSFSEECWAPCCRNNLLSSIFAIHFCLCLPWGVTQWLWGSAVPCTVSGEAGADRVPCRTIWSLLTEVHGRPSPTSYTPCNYKNSSRPFCHHHLFLKTLGFRTIKTEVINFARIFLKYQYLSWI